MPRLLRRVSCVSLRPYGLCLLTVLASARWLAAQPADLPESPTPPPAEAPQETPPERLLAQVTPAPGQRANPTAASDASAPTQTVTLAEQIRNLEKAIEADTQRLDKLRAEGADPMSEYRLAEAGFKACDEKLTTAKVDLERIDQAGGAEDREIQQAMIAEAEKQWTAAKERFNLAIDSRKTSQEQAAALEAKLAKNRDALNKLIGVEPQPVPVTATEAKTAAGPEVVPATTAATPAPLPAVAPTPPTAAAPTVPPAAAPGVAPPDEARLKPPKRELVEAKNQVELKETEALVAEQAAHSVTERIAALDKDIELEHRQLVSARRKSDLAFQTRGELDAEFERVSAEVHSADQIADIQSRRREAETQFTKARREVAERIDRLNELQTQRAALQREALAAASAVEQKQQEVDEAKSQVAALENPFSVTNMLQWLLDHGPRVGVILLAILLLRISAGVSSKRIMHVMIQRGTRGSEQEREDRARTLVGVFRNAFAITTTIGGGLMICEEIGIAIAPLMGGAAVVGLAVAFGAQNLIRDYFYGFVILIENQYKLNDVLQIGSISGQVEQITLRMTVLRDVEGNVHFIPNGKIDSVTNKTHGWSRALIEIGVAYKEDVDRCMQVMLMVAGELHRDPTFASSILEQPEMVGVENLADSAVTIRLLIKTRPLQQWRIRREMLRRIKRRFDELGIEIPFPHQTVYHRHELATQEGEQRSLPHKAA
jgi:small-conductance mechanosensitive channel